MKDQSVKMFWKVKHNSVSKSFICDMDLVSEKATALFVPYSLVSQIALQSKNCHLKIYYKDREVISVFHRHN